MVAFPTTPPQRPPSTCRSVTHKFAIDGSEAFLTIGLLDNGRPGQVFVKLGKDKSTRSDLIRGVCTALSLALQRGLPLREAVTRFGAADPILDYVVRYLTVNFAR